MASQLTSVGPALQPENMNQIAALPLGARIKLNPWTDEVELTRPHTSATVGTREDAV